VLVLNQDRLEIQMVGEFLLKTEIGRPKRNYLVKIERLRKFHALYLPSAGPVYGFPSVLSEADKILNK
jgi:hypothetical protein